MIYLGSQLTALSHAPVCQGQALKTPCVVPMIAMRALLLYVQVSTGLHGMMSWLLPKSVWKGQKWEVVTCPCSCKKACAS